MARSLTADNAAGFVQGLENIAIADARPLKSLYSQLSGRFPAQDCSSQSQLPGL